MLLTTILTLVGCSSPTGGAARAAPPNTTAVDGGPSWPLEIYTIGTAPSPAFPTTLTGWRLDTAWNARVRVFAQSGGDPGNGTRISGPGYAAFPATMNGCNNQRFLVRWRAISDAIIDAFWLDGAGHPSQIVSANAGWMGVGGCQVPALHLSNSNPANSLSDVTVDVQRWTPAP